MPFQAVLDSVAHSLGCFFISIAFGYHACVEDPIFNGSCEEETRIEKVADTLLVPYQYALMGRTLKKREDDTWQCQQRFDYTKHFWIKNIASWVALPVSFVLGGTLKACALLSPDVRERYDQIKHPKAIHSYRDFYCQQGLFEENPVSDEPFISQAVPRRPGDENILSEEKEALVDIAEAFNEAGILWWVDCGTCLGTYRHGGAIPWDFDIDIAVLEPDFENVVTALKKLDHKYKLANLSSRERPASLHKLHLRKDPMKVIDIYYFKIMPEVKTLNFILSQENNIFMLKSWKIREQPFKTPVRFEDVFPLKRAYFDGVPVFMPNHPEKYLERVYGEDLRPAKVYNPITDAYENDLDHPYWKRSFAH